MKTLYCVYDTIAEACGPIVAMAADAAAVRMFGDVANDPQSQLHRHVEDFVLINVGRIDERGRVFIHDNGEPTIVITGKQWKSAQAPDEPQLSLEA